MHSPLSPSQFCNSPLSRTPPSLVHTFSLPTVQDSISTLFHTPHQSTLSTSQANTRQQCRWLLRSVLNPRDTTPVIGNPGGQFLLRSVFKLCLKSSRPLLLLLLILITRKRAGHSVAPEHRAISRRPPPPDGQVAAESIGFFLTFLLLLVGLFVRALSPPLGSFAAPAATIPRPACASPATLPGSVPGGAEQAATEGHYHPRTLPRTPPSRRATVCPRSSSSVVPRASRRRREGAQ